MESFVTLIARNQESFSFLYQEIVDAFPAVRFFDPETEVPSFEGVGLLYLMLSKGGTFRLSVEA